jgi:type I restriction enzyme S subunit
MAVENLITEHLDIWTSAIKTKSAAGRGSSKKLELVGVKKLRELILELAVRGKLVPQDPNDEPASELLKKIEAEKAQLVKEGKLKKQKPLPSISDDEKPFELPIGWEWVRLGNTGLGFTGKTPSTKEQKYFEGNIPFIGPGQITPSGVLLEPDKYLSEEGICFSTEARIGDILMVCIGGSIGKSVICDKRIGFNQQINMLRPLFVVPGYLNNAVSSDNFYKTVLAVSTGSATPIINRSKWEKLLVPICSLAEQHRIVVKVDELMVLCDQLEAQTEANIDAHKTLVKVLLATLTDAKDADELNDNWQTISQHFDVLFTTQASIDQLKQTILQLAVMGKLVKQDPKDEPACKLLERIATEKQQLIKDGKIKKQKALPPITEDEKPFGLPEGWEWVRLGDVYRFLNGFAFKSEWFQEQGTKLLRNINIAHGETKWLETACIHKEMADEYTRFQLEVGDIVISLDRPIINTGLKYAVIQTNDLPCLLLQRVAKFHSLADIVTPDFLSRWLESDLFMNSIDPGRSNGVPHISTKQLEMMAFPLCSSNEQLRIVVQIDELIELCDSLKQRLNQAHTSQLHLTDAIVEQAL